MQKRQVKRAYCLLLFGILLHLKETIKYSFTLLIHHMSHAAWTVIKTVARDEISLRADARLSHYIWAVHIFNSISLQVCMCRYIRVYFSMLTTCVGVKNYFICSAVFIQLSCCSLTSLWHATWSCFWYSCIYSPLLPWWKLN